MPSSEHPYVVRLGRRFAKDERDRAYPLRAITRAAPMPSHRYWRLSAIEDQGQTPMCVGYSGRQWLMMSPVRYKQPQPDAPACYHGAQQFDEWSGEDYDGTSARGLMKFFQSINLVQSYHWASSVEELAQFVLTTGPALIGANWHRSFFTPDSKGYIHPDGNVVGGHEFVCYGYSQTKWEFSFANSWGTDWNPVMRGRFKMKRDEFEALMADQGDMVAATESAIV
jgi:hypothetical protein